MRVTSKGQVTIPQEVRKRLGIEAGSEVDFVWHDEGVVLARREHDEADNWVYAEVSSNFGSIDELDHALSDRVERENLPREAGVLAGMLPQLEIIAPDKP